MVYLFFLPIAMGIVYFIYWSIKETLRDGNWFPVWFIFSVICLFLGLHGLANG